MAARETLFNGKKLVYNAGVETTREYLANERVKKKCPRVKLLVSPFAVPFVPIEIISQDVGGIIQSCTWMKSRTNAGGAVQVIIAGDNDAIKGLNILISKPLEALWKTIGPDFRDIFKPMTLCQLWIDGYHVMTGYVRSCRKQTEVGHKSYAIEIEELGSIYQESIISPSTILGGPFECVTSNPTQIFELAAAFGKTGMDLSTALSFYIQAFIASTLYQAPGRYFRASDGLPFGLRLIALPPPLGGISRNSFISEIPHDKPYFEISGSSFWDFLKSLCPDPFMELFTESGGRTICTGRLATPGMPNVSVLLPGFNYVIARSTPYNIPWIGLCPWPQVYLFTMGVMELLLAGDFIIVTDDDIISKDLGQNLTGQYTAFSVPYTSGISAGKKDGAKPRPSFAWGSMNPLSSGGMSSYGVRELFASLSSTTLSWEGLVGQMLEEVNMYCGAEKIHIPALSTMLNVWFRNHAKFSEGTIKTRAIPYAKPGMIMLYLPTKDGRYDNMRDIGVYYIDNHTYNYQIGSADTSTFSLIRGVPIPISFASTARLFFDWEILPPTPNLTDWEIPPKIA